MIVDNKVISFSTGFIMQAEDEIRELLSDYFDVVYFGETSKINKIYHKDARLYCGSAGSFVALSVPEYTELVAGRVPPAKKGEVREDVIEKIEILAPTMARACVREVMLPKLFTDELVLLRVDNRWSIVAKAWHYDLAT